MPAAAEPGREFRYYDLITGVFVAVLLCSNLIGPSKLSQVGPWEIMGVQIPATTFSAGILFFPMSYLFGDFLTEVYGYARARRVVWTGFGALAFASFMSWAVLALPSAPGWAGQGALREVFGLTPRIVVASLVAFWAGEFANSYALARLKVLTAGRWLFSRTIGSTVVGAAVDSVIFYPVAFLGIWPTRAVITVLLTNYVIKIVWEVIATPFTYAFVKALKRAEGVDHFDRDTDFNPFSLSTR
jgi:uncharacterized integral membrane protein (TIGR00697 family)